MVRRLLALVFCFAATGVAANDSYSDGVSGQEAAALVTEAMAAARVPSIIVVPPIRPFPACSVTPTVAPLQGSWSTAEIRCEGDTPWTRAMRTGAQTIRASVAASADHDPATGPMVVGLTRSLTKGEMIAPEDIALMPRGTHAPSDLFGSLEEVIGRRMKVTLGAEQILQTRHLEPAWIVRSGTPLMLEIRIGPITVMAAGEALENGRYGDVIALKNLGSQQIVRGTVVGENRVSLRPNI